MLNLHRSALSAALAAACGASAYSEIVGHWRFDESKGAVAADDIGGLDGALLGGAAFGPDQGIDGGAVHLSRATNSVVDLGDIFNFPGQVDYTVSFWARLNATGDTSPNTIPLARHTSGQVSGYFFNINTTGGCYGQVSKVMFYTSNGCGGEVISQTPVNDGEWHHIVGVHRAGASKKIYVDGAPAEATGAPANNPGTAAHLLVGGVFFGNSPTGLFDGFVDDVQIYDHPLDCRKVQAMFDKPGSEASQLDSSDLDTSGGVNGADLGILLLAWGDCPKSGDCIADLDCDGTVDGADLGIVLLAWTG